VFAATPPTAPVRAAPIVFVLAGQSNMEGFGLPVPVETPDARVRDLTDGDKPAVDPLGDAPGVGPGRSFGLTLVDGGAAAEVGLVNCAVGGSRLDDWLPTAPAATSLYDACLNSVKAALVRVGGRLGGVLFMQGETDARWSNPSARWGASFAAFVAGIRRDLDAPALPVVVGRIRQVAKYAWKVRRAQLTAAKTLPKVAVVNTDDLPVNGIHFTPDGYATLGERMAAAWIGLTKTPAAKPKAKPKPKPKPKRKTRSRVR
jgi:hypothetical protein